MARVAFSGAFNVVPAFLRRAWQGHGLARLLGTALVGSVAVVVHVTLVFGQAASGPVGPAPAEAAANPMAEPLRLIEQARQSYAQNVKDYTCLFIKRERIGSDLEPQQLVEMKVRAQPFAVYLRFLGPKEMVGQEACYVTGANNGMMRIHPAGIRGAVGFISLDPRDPRVMKTNRHTITEAGIGNLIERYQKRWQMERGWNQTQVRIADFEYDKRPCTRVESLHPQQNGQFYSYRNVVYFDKQTHLPIRVETYDWPRPNGAPQGDLLESYSYVNLRFNVGLPDEVFKH